MATRSASLPIEQTYLARAWLAVVAILLVAAVIVTIAVAIGRSTPAGGIGGGARPRLRSGHGPPRAARRERERLRTVPVR